MKIDWNLVGYFYLPKEKNEIKRSIRNTLRWLGFIAGLIVYACLMAYLASSA